MRPFTGVLRVLVAIWQGGGRAGSPTYGAGRGGRRVPLGLVLLGFILPAPAVAVSRAASATVVPAPAACAWQAPTQTAALAGAARCGARGEIVGGQFEPRAGRANPPRTG